MVRRPSGKPKRLRTQAQRGQTKIYSAVACKDKERDADCGDAMAYRHGHRVAQTLPGALILPDKYSGEAKKLCASIAGANVSGEFANSPIAEIPALIGKFIREATASSLGVGGRAYPVASVTPIIDAFQQSLGRYIFEQCVFSCGSFVSLLPLDTPVSGWRDMGIIAQRDQNDDVYWVDIDPQLVGVGNLTLLDPMRCTPTGDPEWVCVYVADDGNPYHLHANYCVQMVSGADVRAGWGASPVWVSMEPVSQYMMAVHQFAESRFGGGRDIIHGEFPRQTGDDITRAYERRREAALNGGGRYGVRPLVVSAPNMSVLRTGELMTVAEFDKIREIVINKIALAFGVPVLEIESRGGVGYGAQAESQNQLYVMNGVLSMLYALARAINRFFPRVTISVNSPRDPSQLPNATAANMAVTVMQAAGYTQAQIQSELHTKYGFPPPEAERESDTPPVDDDVNAAIGAIAQFAAVSKMRVSGELPDLPPDVDQFAFWDAALPRYAGMLRAEDDDDPEPDDTKPDRWEWLYVARNATYVSKSGIAVGVENERDAKLVIAGLTAHLIARVNGIGIGDSIDIGDAYRDIGGLVLSAAHAGLVFGRRYHGDNPAHYVSLLTRVDDEIRKLLTGAENATPRQFAARLQTFVGGVVAQFVYAGIFAAGARADKISDKAQKKSSASVNHEKFAKPTERSRAWKRNQREARKPYRWVLGNTENHCADCKDFSDMGAVKPKSNGLSPFLKNGTPIVPKSRELECNGYNCDCTITRG